MPFQTFWWRKAAAEKEKVERLAVAFFAEAMEPQRADTRGDCHSRVSFTKIDLIASGFQ